MLEMPMPQSKLKFGVQKVWCILDLGGDLYKFLCIFHHHPAVIVNRVMDEVSMG